jgi:apolipoprotein N-acyltransferase
VLNADFVFWPSVAFMATCNLYFGRRIGGDRIAMQWGLDGRPTWYASKAIGLWGVVGIALAVRLLIWIASTYIPTKVHGVEAGLLIASVVIAASHAFVLRKAVQRV